MNESKKLALAARYRPQTFADVAGQDMVKAVLSRACAEDKPACAYLFSGTRGVGKTTIARIFAKALNCQKAPCAEPCNSCPSCQKIVQGNHIDVIEIDGASNNKVEDIRALRETVGYAPMEGRYKVFIIDEAHMLSTSAFNALLKTLEEPPPRVIFIMATTEAHKFPITIVSRCQHFTFRHLNEDELVKHLKKVLDKEKIPFEEEALFLLAKRAQGSVRDSMSLLDQTLALGNDTLTVQGTRDVLGLAGQDFFEKLFAAMVAADCASVVQLTQAILRRGVDIGFFISELAGYFRNLFLIQQSGAGIADILQLTPSEKNVLASMTNKLSAQHLHAAWQMVLESQRSVVQSTEPASSLELLLLNLALLPKLLPIERLPAYAAAKVQGKSVPVEQKDIPLKKEPETVQEAETKSTTKEETSTEKASPLPLERKNPSVLDNDDDDSDEEGDDEEEEDNLTLGNVQPRHVDWQGFCSFYLEKFQEKSPVTFAEQDLRSLAAERFGSFVTIKPVHQFQYDRLMHASSILEEGLRAFLHVPALTLSIKEPEITQTDAELLKTMDKREELQSCFSLLDAVVEGCKKR